VSKLREPSIEELLESFLDTAGDALVALFIKLPEQARRLDQALADANAVQRADLSAWKTTSSLDEIRRLTQELAIAAKYAMWTAEREVEGSA
jgi:hypothetical protein